MTEAIIAFVAVVQTAVGCIVGYAITRRHAASKAPAERAVLRNPRGLRALCMLHVFDDKDGAIYVTLVPTAPVGAAVDWPAVGDAIADAASRVEADASRLAN